MNASVADPALAPLMQMLAQQLPGMPPHDLARFAASISLAEPYAPWDGWRQGPDYPVGAVHMFTHVGQVCYPGVERSVAVYVPHQYDGSTPAQLMVFQDGSRYLGPEVNAVQVLDALIGAGTLAPTIAVFIEPGTTGPGLPLYGGAGNRSVEYDAPGPAYVRFLLDELLPVALDGYHVRQDGAGRAIAGISSGGMCALNAAFERPDAFSRVMSHCGSFVDIRGGHALAGSIRRSAGAPLRVFLQSGRHDLDIAFGNWELANRTMAAALAYRGHAHRLVIGDGGHSLKHGGAIFPESLAWLWAADPAL